MTERMKLEFNRYGLSRFRSLTGTLQMMGSLGLLLGYLYPIFTLIAASGLFLLMSLGVAVRIKVGDPWYMAMPALTYALLNLFIALGYREWLLLR